MRRRSRCGLAEALPKRTGKVPPMEGSTPLSRVLAAVDLSSDGPARG